ncbi:hypothetical protein B0G84_5706 [Paraburkholderia sp. BL8N3]|nr:hypothetical protein [Paraburkholderia sp. BL8N3]TCK36693.1 hypothetical protein B0G84_5706 [Paraburkholderia sp. BL8N3]
MKPQETHHFNRLNEAEAERLALLAEEMAEAIHAIGKILRHGYESKNPLMPQGPSNRDWLEQEVAHVYAAARLMFDAGDIRRVACEDHESIKQESLHRYMHHQPRAH